MPTPGIYLGVGYVIHYTVSEKGNANPKPPCTKCGYQENKHLGVAKSCTDCFISKDSLLTTGHSLYLYQCGVSSIEYAIINSGSCSTHPPKPPKEVVKTAPELYKKNSFGNYDFVVDNYEDFATFCETGVRCGTHVDFGTIKTIAGVAIGAGALTVASIEYIKKRREKNRNKSVQQNS